MLRSILPLGEIANIRTIQTFKNQAPEYDPEGNARAISIRDIVGRWPLDFNTLPRIHLNQNQVENCLQAGDILMPARGDYYPARRFNEAHINAIPIGQINVISPIREVDATYLSWYLSQSRFQRTIQDSLVGTSIKSLNKSKLLAMPVHVPPIQIQCSIAQLQEMHLRRILLQREQIVLNDVEVEAVCQSLLDEVRSS
jgi:restriction endonuclease S subunit